MNVQLKPNMGHCNLKIVFVAVDVFSVCSPLGREDAHHLRTPFLCQHELKR